ncbi:uncharacterized protein [Henckelia pumila]|uniref:uncharacterized protein n=1 Tax=Henckelia pumila TaxID=405737 RepID=UPI003C6E1788
MAPLHRFKMLATKCTVASSPTRSPSTSPAIPLRRRKTLRMLLSHVDGGGGGGARTPPNLRCGRSPDRTRCGGQGSPSEKGKKAFSVSRKLKDLFVMSSPPVARRRSSPPTSGGGAGGRARSQHLPAATFRQRLMRKAWRPLLVVIPE